VIDEMLHRARPQRVVCRNTHNWRCDRCWAAITSAVLTCSPGGFVVLAGREGVYPKPSPSHYFSWSMRVNFACLTVRFAQCRDKKGKDMRLLTLAGLALFSTMAVPVVASATCLTLDNTSNSIAAFWQNNCDVWVSVRWTDQGSCRTGCMEDVAPGRRASVTKAKGQVNWRECQGRYCTISY
jgi:hypothetical protein